LDPVSRTPPCWRVFSSASKTATGDPGLIASRELNDSSHISASAATGLRPRPELRELAERFVAQLMWQQRPSVGAVPYDEAP
jgi:hypothetical protein